MKIMTLLKLPKIVSRNMKNQIPRENRMIVKRLVFRRMIMWKILIHNRTALLTKMLIHLLEMKMALGLTILTMM